MDHKTLKDLADMDNPGAHAEITRRYKIAFGDNRDDTPNQMVAELEIYAMTGNYRVRERFTNFLSGLNMTQNDNFPSHGDGTQLLSYWDEFNSFYMGLATQTNAPTGQIRSIRDVNNWYSAVTDLVDQGREDEWVGGGLTSFWR